jgi:hypothetical protein
MGRSFYELSDVAAIDDVLLRGNISAGCIDNEK